MPAPSSARAATLMARRSVKKDFQAAWLVQALTCIDLTTLSGDDTPGRVRRLCAKARRPLSDDLLAALDLRDDPPTVGAVCVYPTMVSHAGEGAGRIRHSRRLGRDRLSLRARRRCLCASPKSATRSDEGAGEIDIVITRAHWLNERNWSALYDESRRHARGLRAGAYEGDPGDRRA